MSARHAALSELATATPPLSWRGFTFAESQLVVIHCRPTSSWLNSFVEPWMRLFVTASCSLPWLRRRAHCACCASLAVDLDASLVWHSKNACRWALGWLRRMLCTYSNSAWPQHACRVMLGGFRSPHVPHILRLLLRLQQVAVLEECVLNLEQRPPGLYSRCTSAHCGCSQLA